MGRARENGRRAVCGNNLRQLGTMFFAYSDMNEGWFPAKPKFGDPSADVKTLATVQPDSTLTDIKAVSTPGEPFTREAFRLLREGPKWVPAGSGGKAVAEVVMVKVVFK